MEEFESFFSQLIPTAPEHDIWLLGRDTNNTNNTNSTNNTNTPTWSLNNSIQGLDPNIKEQIAQLQQQQQQSQQMQLQLQNFQNLQNQQFQLRQQQLSQQIGSNNSNTNNSNNNNCFSVIDPNLSLQNNNQNFNFNNNINLFQSNPLSLPVPNNINNINNSNNLNNLNSSNNVQLSIQQQLQNHLQQQQFPFISSNNNNSNNNLNSSENSPIIVPQNQPNININNNITINTTNFTTPNFTSTPSSPVDNFPTTTTKQPKTKKSPSIPKQPKAKTPKKDKNSTPITSVTTTPNVNSTPPIISTPDINSNNYINENGQLESPENYFNDSDDDSKKKNVNRMNQNLASRNYRQRRKDYIKEIENKMAALTFENHQLKKENESLKETGGVEIMRPEPELVSMVMEGKQIIVQLSYALKKNDERTMIYLLHLFHCATAKRYSIIEKEVEKIVHPYTQGKIAAMGYVPKAEKWWFLNCIAGPGSDSWFSLYKKEAEITEEQSNQLDSLRAQNYKLDQSLIAERELLDKDIKRFYYTKILVLPNNPLEIGDIPCHPYVGGELSQQQPINQPLEISQLLDFARKLESLKRNFIQHRNIMLDTIASLSSILTPRQEAMLLVRIHYYTGYDIGHMELLKEVWTNIVSQSKNVTAQPMNISEALKKMTESTNVIPTVEQIVKPPQFHQYTPKPIQQKKTKANSDGTPKRVSKSNKNNNKDFDILPNKTNVEVDLPSINKNEPSSQSTVLPTTLTNNTDKKYQWYSYPGTNQ